MFDEDRQKQERLKSAQSLLKEFSSAIGEFVRAARAEYKKDRSGFRAYRQGQLKQELNQDIAQGFKVTRDALERVAKPAIDRGFKVVREIRSQAQNIARVGSSSNGQTAERAFKEALQTIDAAEKKPEQGLENYSDSADLRQKQTETERPKVRDELLYADGKFSEGITKEDMLAIAELLTAQKGDRLPGDAAKGLTIEYNGEVLLTTDRDGLVATNRLNDRDLMSKFDSRATSEIAEFQAQAEELKSELKASIDRDALDRQALERQVDGKSAQADLRFQNAASQTPVVLSQDSPEAKQVLQEMGSDRAVKTPEQATERDRIAPLEQGEVGNDRPTQPKVKSSQSSEVTEVTEPYNRGKVADYLNRLTKVADRAFSQNFKGSQDLAKGRVQAPDGTIIEKTSTRVGTKGRQSYDLAIEKDGVRYEIASYSNGRFKVKDGIVDAVPALKEIPANIDADGAFVAKSVVPQFERPERTQSQETQQTQAQETQQAQLSRGDDHVR
jgi:hypothetical protein